MNSSPSFVGIDVSKAELDIYVRPDGSHWMVPNDAKGHTQLVDQLSPIAPTLIVLGATGGLECTVAFSNLGMSENNLP